MSHSDRVFNFLLTKGKRILGIHGLSMKLQLTKNFLNQNTLLACLACAAVSSTPIEPEFVEEGILFTSTL